MRILSIRTGFLSYLYKGKSVNMKLENYEVHLPNYSIGDAIYDKIGPVCESYGKTVLVIGGKRALDAAFDKIKAAVDQTNLEIIGKELYGKDCTYQTVEKLRRMSVYQKADMVFGVGGGKALDTVKCLCITDDKPVFSFPTIASNCSACTSVSIMYNEDGTFLKPNFFVRPVMHAFIDTEIIAKAPSQYMWAGIFLTKDFTPDYNSGLAHAIFYALTKYPVIEQRHLHGEVVGFGVLLALLVDGQEEEFEKIYQLNREIGLPVSLKEIEITEDEWKESMGHIPKMSDVAHYPYKVTREMLEDAMQKLKERVRKDQSHEE